MSETASDRILRDDFQATSDPAVMRAGPALARVMPLWRNCSSLKRAAGVAAGVGADADAGR